MAGKVPAESILAAFTVMLTKADTAETPVALVEQMLEAAFDAALPQRVATGITSGKWKSVDSFLTPAPKPVVTDEMIDAYGRAWAGVPLGGVPGARRRAGLEAALAVMPPADPR